MEDKLSASSIESMVAMNICIDKRVGRKMFYELFSAVSYDSEKGMIRFLTVKELWKYGLVIKRYLEYPCNQASSIDQIFEEIEHYLSKGEYIVNFIDKGKAYEDVSWIVGLSADARKVIYQIVDRCGKARKETLSYEEYSKRYWTLTADTAKVRLDIYQPMTMQSTREITLQELKKKMKKQKLSFYVIMKCLLCTHRRGDFSKATLYEWYRIFCKYESYLLEEGYLDMRCAEKAAGDDFCQMEKPKNSYIHMFCLLAGYNRILSKTRNHLTRRENAKSVEEC